MDALRLIPGSAPGTAPPADTPPSTSPSEGITFTLKHAAEVCGVDPQTVRRRLKQLEQQGDLHGAHRNDDGSWTIPQGALRAAGLQPGKPSPPDRLPITPTDQPGVMGGHASPAPPDIPPVVAELIAELRARLESKDEIINSKDEVIAAERQTSADLRANLADLRQAIARGERQLMPGPTPPADTATAELDDQLPADTTTLTTRPTTSTEPDPPRRRWWRRGRWMIR